MNSMRKTLKLPDGVIKGASEIEDAITQYFNASRMKLKATIRGKETQYLYVVIDAINNVLGPELVTRTKGEVIYYDTKVYAAIIYLKGVLDTILEQGITTVRAPVPLSEILRMDERLLPNHGDIAYYYRCLETQRRMNISKIRIENGKIIDYEDDRFRDAVSQWIDSISDDPDWVDWVNWYYNNFPHKNDKDWKYLAKDFRRIYRAGLNDFTTISNYLENVAKTHSNSKTSIIPLFLTIEQAKLFETFSSAMDENRAKKWLKELTYKPWEDLFKSPLLQLRIDGKPVYCLVPWIFTPRNVFWSTWIDPLISQRGTTTRGRMGQGYGNLFEKYINLKFETEALIHLTNLGSIIVTSKEYPEIKPFLDRLGKTEGFEVDIVLRVGKKISLAISCKADTFVMEKEIRKKDFFFMFPNVKNLISTQLKNITEILVEAKCLDSISRLKADIGLGNSKVYPILVTSRTGPLSSNKVRRYYSELGNLPEVPVITISSLLQLVASPTSFVEYYKKFLEGTL